ncbi:hypothetical protein CY34DRAFT_212600 [Suillus luteus UH-Slu-Lm8-n1]|uniref:Uncharacterized protein n=1 Tax=Suillus luteus UH-Slu-Lm8-n1 TaxID=930992 RepID=A0A0D0BXK3_9AGAM|nr:hypothetical protein CY34DRAFT_212600 [Suillus luteus UH-Slu-Lm8-n1]
MTLVLLTKLAVSHYCLSSQTLASVVEISWGGGVARELPLAHFWLNRPVNSRSATLLISPEKLSNR